MPRMPVSGYLLRLSVVSNPTSGWRQIACSSETATARSSRIGEIERGQDAGRDGRDGRDKRDIWETHHSIDTWILREDLVETADGGQEDDVAVIEKWDPGSC